MANNDFNKTTGQDKENLRKILTPIIATAFTIIGCIAAIVMMEKDDENILGCSIAVFIAIFLLISTILLIQKIDPDNTGKYRIVVHYLHIAIFSFCIIGIFTLIYGEEII
jgi:hypothetical protein